MKESLNDIFHSKFKVFYNKICYLGK